MFELKPITADAIPAALEKALRYRMLNEPEQAESICEDVLAIDPDNQEALATLILALTDRLYGPRPVSPQTARDLLPRLRGEYERAYYAGIVWEREGIAWLRSEKPRAGSAAYECSDRGDGPLRAGRGSAPAGQRRRHPAVEQLRRMIVAHPDVAPAEEPAEAAANLGE